MKATPPRIWPAAAVTGNKPMANTPARMNRSSRLDCTVTDALAKLATVTTTLRIASPTDRDLATPRIRTADPTRRVQRTQECNRWI